MSSLGVDERVELPDELLQVVTTSTGLDSAEEEPDDGRAFDLTILDVAEVVGPLAHRCCGAKPELDNATARATNGSNDLFPFLQGKGICARIRVLFRSEELPMSGPQGLENARGPWVDAPTGTPCFRGASRRAFRKRIATHMRSDVPRAPTRSPTASAPRALVSTILASASLPT
jgi:hypothetical protein